MAFTLLLSLLLHFEISLACKYKFIHNASELIQFSNDVNSGTTYEGYTVYLVADINFNNALSKKFEPIGNFQGTFDGQGYVVRNLVIESSFRTTGLFGYLYGWVIIKNTVLDSSCSFTSSFTTSRVPIVL